MAGKTWTQDEDQYLRTNYLTTTCAAMGPPLGRTEKAVGHRCRFLGLEVPEPKKGDRVGRFELLSDKYLVVRYGQQIGMVRARCECGKEIEVKLTAIRSNPNKSCGCVKRAKASARIIKQNTTHGMSRHPLYRQYKGMVARCIYPSHISYKNYGARGIRVCDGWLQSFEAFANWAMTNGWREGLTIERQNSNGNYEPTNCCLVTQKIQCRNKRNNRLLTAFGETKTITEWCEDPRCQTQHLTIRSRLDLLGWDAERAITTPTRPKRVDVSPYCA